MQRNAALGFELCEKNSPFQHANTLGQRQHVGADPAHQWVKLDSPHQLVGPVSACACACSLMQPKCSEFTLDFLK